MRQMNEAVKDSTRTLQPTISSVSSTTDIKHRLVQIQPPIDNSTGKYKYGGIRESSWLGNFVICGMVNSILHQHSNYVRK
jgi:hypothetical protein